MPLGYGHPIPSPVLHVPPDRLRSLSSLSLLPPPSPPPSRKPSETFAHCEESYSALPLMQETHTAAARVTVRGGFKVRHRLLRHFVYAKLIFRRSHFQIFFAA